MNTPFFFNVAVALGLASLVHASAANPERPNAKPAADRPLRVLVVDVHGGTIVERLRKMKIETEMAPLNQLDLDHLKNTDVILLPTGWATDPDLLARFDARKDAFQRFVKRGGGLLVCQPNPVQPGTCTPALLPYPITFRNGYDDSDKTRLNLAQDHFITEDLPDSDMPFPADPILKIDPRYHVLAKQKKNDFPSLAVCGFGDGRIVVQTANENYAATIPLTDVILRRMIEWAAGREVKKRK